MLQGNLKSPEIWKEKILMIETIKEMMDIKSFLEIYGIPRTSYFRQVKKGRLKVTKDGRRTYIKRKDAEEWLAKFGEN